MFSSEVKIISVPSKGSCNRDSSPNIKHIKNQAQSQKNQKNFANQATANRSKKVSSAPPANRRKFFHNNNNNNNSSTIKNQNISANKSTHNTLVNSSNGSNSCNNNSNNNESSTSKKPKEVSPRSKNPVNQKSASFKSPAKSSMVMSNTPNTTQSITATTSAPVSPASYTLDFLHSVGVQMTAGSGRTYTPLPSPSRHAPYINSVRSRCSFSQEPPNVIHEPHNVPNHARATYKDYAFDTPNAHSSRNVASPLVAGGFMYHAAQGGYHNNNYLGHNQYYHSQHNMPYHAASSHHFNGNRTQPPKKNWNWSPNGIKRCCNISVNKFGSISSNDLASSQTLPRTTIRNHQSYRNLRYVLTDSGSFIGNSRSPTPSPKSESPSLCKVPNSQNLNSVPLSAADQGALTMASLPLVEVPAPNPSLNGYESDSSHSSYRQNEFEFRSKNRTVHAPYHMGEMTSLINLPTYSDEDLLKSQATYYGSHQNLTFWNTAINPAYSPHGLYSTHGSGSSEPGVHYVNDLASVNSKRSQSHHRSHRGRRHLYTNFRGHTFHEAYTPPDKFLARAHLVEVRNAPDVLLNNSKWDQLSQGIWTKFITSQQTEETYKKKMYLWRYLYVTIKKAYPRFGLYLVGSTISGFGADTSDVDMCLVCRNSSNIEPRMEAVFNLTLLKEYLSQSGVFEQFNLIEAKVPILRFKDSIHMLEIDLNFNNCVGIRNTHLLHCYSQLDWRLRPLVLVTKLWAQYHNINNAKNMTISSYSLVLMVIHFLQCGVSPPVLPCLHEMFPEKFNIILKSNDLGGFVDQHEDIGPYESQNMQTLGELFLNFLEYYSNFDYTQYAISVRTGSILPIEVCRQAKSIKNDIHQWKELCIEEPFDLTNTARSVYDCETFERVKAVFIASWKILLETLDLNSIFTPIIPNSSPPPSSYSSQVPLNITSSVS